jgi:hypothetical protein
MEICTWLSWANRVVTPILSSLYQRSLAVSAEPPIPTSWTRPAWLMASSTRAKVALSRAWVVSTMELIFSWASFLAMVSRSSSRPMPL